MELCFLEFHNMVKSFLISATEPVAVWGSSPLEAQRTGLLVLLGQGHGEFGKKIGIACVLNLRKKKIGM